MPEVVEIEQDENRRLNNNSPSRVSYEASAKLKKVGGECNFR